MMWFRVLVTAMLAVALSLAIYAGPLPFAFATAGVVIVLAYGWPRLTDSPQPRLTSVMLAVTGMVGLLSVWFGERTAPLDWLAPVAGGALLWTFIQHLARGIGASDAVANVSAQIAGAVIVLCVCTLLAALLVPEGDRAIILISLVSLTAALAAIALPWPALYTTPLALGVAVLTGMATGAAVDGRTAGWLVSGVLGALMASLVVAVDLLLGQVARGRYQSRDVLAGTHAEAGAQAPAGPEAGGQAPAGPEAGAQAPAGPEAGGQAPVEGAPRATDRLLNKTRSLGVQLALGAAPVSLSGVIIYIAERAVLFG